MVGSSVQKIKLGLNMAFDYVIQWRSRRLGYCHSLGNILDYRALLKLKNKYKQKIFAILLFIFGYIEKSITFATN